MTLDTFQKEVALAVTTMTESLQRIFAAGVEAKLDDDLMVTIVNRELAKAQG